MLKSPSHQRIFLDMLKSEILHLAKNKDGSYIVKEIYKNFDREVLEEVTIGFLADLETFISDKYAICVFKEIVHKISKDPVALTGLFKKFSKYYNEMKVNTFYHFGIQEFISVRFG